MLRLSFLLSCIIHLALTEPDSKKPKAPKSTDYGPMIKQMQAQIDAIDTASLSQLLTTQQTELSALQQKLAKCEKTQLETTATLQSLSTLSKRVDTLESSTTNSDIDSISRSLERLSRNTQQLTDNQSKMDAKLSELSKNYKSLFDGYQSMQSDFKALSAKQSKTSGDSADDRISKNVDKIRDNVQKQLSELKAQQSKLQNSMQKVSKNMANQQILLAQVQDMTITSQLRNVQSYLYDNMVVFWEWMKANVDYLQKEFAKIDWNKVANDITQYMVKMGKVVLDYVNSVDWKGYYEAISNPKNYELFVEWLKDVYNYVHFWWTQAIWPAIVRQATELYYLVQDFAAQVVVFVHQHMLYKEVLTKITPFLEMANIPSEYYGLVMDGVLVMFALSAVVSMFVILSVCCDCCCPRTKPTPQVRDAPRQNPKRRRRR